MSHSHDHSHENCSHDHSHDDHTLVVSAEAAANSLVDAKSILSLIVIVVLTVCFWLSGQ